MGIIFTFIFLGFILGIIIGIGLATWYLNSEIEAYQEEILELKHRLSFRL